MVNSFLKNSILQFLLVVICALIFRIWNLNIVEFKGDEAINLYLAALPRFMGIFAPGSTISSFGILNPPLINYFLLPITLFSVDPRIVSGYIAVINSFAIGFFFLFLRNFFSLHASFATSILFAFAPWSIIYSRKIWAQDFLLPLVVSFLFSSAFILKGRKKFWILYMVSAFFLIQIHQPSILFVSLFSVFFLIQKPSLSFKFILLGIFIGIIPFIPYLNYQLLNGCPDCSLILNTKGNTTPDLSWEIFLRPFQIINNGNFSFLLGDDMTLFMENYSYTKWASIFLLLEYIFLPLGTIFIIKKVKKLSFIAFTIVTLPIVYFILRIVPHMHYFTILIPLLFVSIAASIDFLFKKKVKVLKFTTISLIMLIIISSIIYIFSFFRFVQSQRFLRGDYGSTYFENARTAKEYFGSHAQRNDYEEMFLAYYISRDFIYADSAGGKMLYDFESTKQNMLILERELVKTPVDFRVINELVSYYTSDSFDESVLQELKEKSDINKGFKEIFEQVDKYYREVRPK